MENQNFIPSWNQIMPKGIKKSLILSTKHQSSMIKGSKRDISTILTPGTKNHALWYN
jgi:hypothetical protein